MCEAGGLWVHAICIREKQPDAADAERGFCVVGSGKRGWGRWDGLRTTGIGFEQVSRNGPGTRGGEWRMRRVPGRNLREGLSREFLRFLWFDSTIVCVCVLCPTAHLANKHVSLIRDPERNDRQQSPT